MFVLSLLFLTICVLVAVAFFTLLERKVLSYIHFRKGPNKISIWGLMQPIADAMKLVSKNNRSLSWSSFFFFLPPIFMFTTSLVIWMTYPFWSASQSFSFSILYVYILLGIGTYGLIFTGWISKSKYALLGALRAVCQSISYEVALSIFFMIFVLLYKSTSISVWLGWGDFFFYKFPLLFFFFFISLAELNRPPFDLSEGESELVSGYSVEYGGISYTMIFLSENIMIFFSTFMVSVFFFPWGSLYWFFWSFFSFFFILIRGIVPRIRYDILMEVCWTVITPGVILSLIFYFTCSELF